MNYLAHAYLSFNNKHLLLGNMCSDFIKGKKKLDYSLAIQQGIVLHRAIDEFTDTHSSTAEAKVFFKPFVGLYAGAFVDVVYDHFLATDKNEFINDDALKKFTTNTYNILQKNISVLPEKFQNIFPYMQKQNWLYNYQFNWGIEKSFEGLVRRAKYLSSWKEAFTAFENNYTALQNCYKCFFPEIKYFVNQKMQELLKA
ncbi:MAG: DUF479 domain-containing protein [Bacteroidetes bacterium]|nr:DUF479 domain-containing protein [Bacteroidota bacterium]MBS1648499.1 DUF479 domain-containing protein [Bacteroidota bacterium]